ncbi:MAG TPA: urate hydroxylase PuuD [Caulobacterales bacterium]|nr:urate hydroxylase PuuD [Caulobacterales bacterium]
MAGFLSNIRYVAWTGLVLAVVFLLYYAIGVRGFAVGDGTFWEAAFRFAHVLSGIMWIGLLYYFNFVQIPNAPKIPEEHRGPSIGKVITPAALFWFRWGAMSTLVFGLLLAYLKGYLVAAFTLGLAQAAGFDPNFCRFIGIGMWLATIMWFNVWFVIWPNQQRALNIDNKFPDLAADAKAKSAKTAMLFSRTNTLLSIPMLIAMTGAQTLG